MVDLGILKQSFQKSFEHLLQTFKTLQLGRASTSLVENIDVYIPSRGSTSKMNGVGNIIIVDSQTIKIEPRDKSTLKAMETAIHDAKLGFNPLNNGDSLLIKIPALTTERRAELAKVVKRDGEDAKVSLRNARQDMQKTIKTAHEAKEISDTDKGSLEKKIDEITKEYNEKIDEAVKHKSEEIMKI